MEILGLIGIVVAIVLIIYLSMKGYSILFVAPLSSIVVIVTNGMDFFSSLVGPDNSYMRGLTNFVINYFAVFLLGAILAKYIEKSGAAQSIAQKVLSATGTDKPFSVLIAVFLIGSILTYGGISLFVVLFVIVPLAKPLFKELNIAWNLITIPVMLGIGTFTMTMMPGTPSIQNVVPTAYLGTTVTAAPLLGVIGSVVAIIFGLWYMNYALNKSIANGETFADYDSDTNTTSDIRTDIPSFFVSILPMLVLIVIILIGSSFKVPNIVLIGLGIAILVSGVLFNKYIPNQKVILNAGSVNAISPVFMTSSAVAFGVVVTNAPGFTAISNFILNIPGDPLIGLSVAATAMAGIAGSASGGLGIAMEAFSGPYLEMGMNPEVMHRVSAIASGVLTIMPHAGVVLTLLAVTGLTHKNGFKYQFILMTAGNLLALIAAVITAIIFY
ncbi:GntP family permease [Bacillus sp. B15-48]|uniref:GntP family permease n=1 Tax=Bacillus sp. B15-48 TaxID=1548601 RepID=UPI00193F8B89|nr:GntP family permease [Bacillus sp. B15-48]MBM4764573.1 GntP family permease [Bacillus sp. B15-48]